MNSSSRIMIVLAFVLMVIPPLDQSYAASACLNQIPPGQPLPVNFAGRGFDLAAHEARIRAWRPTTHPQVDIRSPPVGTPTGELSFDPGIV